MRRTRWTLLLPGLLAGAVGCFHFQHTAGVCDCDPQPAAGTLYTYPGGARPAVPAAAAAPHPVAAPPAGLVGPPIAPAPAIPQTLPVPPRAVEPPTLPKG